MLSVYAILFFFWSVPDIGIFGGLTLWYGVLTCCLPCIVPSCYLLYPLWCDLV